MSVDVDLRREPIDDPAGSQLLGAFSEIDDYNANPYASYWMEKRL